MELITPNIQIKLLTIDANNNNLISFLKWTSHWSTILDYTQSTCLSRWCISKKKVWNEWLWKKNQHWNFFVSQFLSISWRKQNNESSKSWFILWFGYHQNKQIVNEHPLDERRNHHLVEINQQHTQIKRISSLFE